jgi:hypothetical protein
MEICDHYDFALRDFEAKPIRVVKGIVSSEYVRILSVSLCLSLSVYLVYVLVYDVWKMSADCCSVGSVTFHASLPIVLLFIRTSTALELQFQFLLHSGIRTTEASGTESKS